MVVVFGLMSYVSLLRRPYLESLRKFIQTSQTTRQHQTAVKFLDGCEFRKLYLAEYNKMMLVESQRMSCLLEAK